MINTAKKNVIDLLTALTPQCLNLEINQSSSSQNASCAILYNNLHHLYADEDVMLSRNEVRTNRWTMLTNFILLLKSAHISKLTKQDFSFRLWGRESWPTHKVTRSPPLPVFRKAAGWQCASPWCSLKLQSLNGRSASWNCWGPKAGSRVRPCSCAREMQFIKASCEHSESFFKSSPAV